MTGNESQFESEVNITPSEAGRIFGVDPKTITRWAVAGKLPYTRTLGGHRRYKLSDVRALATGEDLSVPVEDGQ